MRTYSSACTALDDKDIASIPGVPDTLSSHFELQLRDQRQRVVRAASGKDLTCDLQRRQRLRDNFTILMQAFRIFRSFLTGFREFFALISNLLLRYLRQSYPRFKKLNGHSGTGLRVQL